MHIFKCSVCGYTYNEAREKMSWEKLPSNWECPVCGVKKSAFERDAPPAQSSQSSSSSSSSSNPVDGPSLVIIGSGIAGVNFAKKHRMINKRNKITIITKENEWHYSRPYLSHGFSDPKIDEKLLLKRYLDLQKTGMEILTNTEVTSIEPTQKKICIKSTHHSIHEITYDKLVLATGSDAFIPPSLNCFRPYFNVLNTLEDLRHIQNLRKEILPSRKINCAIIGGGLIGCEMASDLHKAGDHVHLFHVMDRLMERQLSVLQSQKLLNLFTQQGISVQLDFNAETITKTDETFILNNLKTQFDFILVATGFRPRIELAKAAGLECNRGICTDNRLQTNDPSIYALGDAAEIQGNLYPFVAPIMEQANWLAQNIDNKHPDNLVIGSHAIIHKIHHFTI